MSDSVKTAREIMVKTPVGVKTYTILFHEDLAEGETITGFSEAPTITPSGVGHIQVDASSVIATGAKVRLSGGKGEVAFTSSAGSAVLAATGHDLADGDPVHVMADNSRTLPAELSPERQYYVLALSADTFSLALTPGGAPISFAAVGQGRVGRDYILSMKMDTDQTNGLPGKVKVWCRA